MNGIVELIIVFMLGAATGYAYRDHISRIRRAKYRERRQAEKSAAKYGADDVLVGCEKWDESPPVTPSAGSAVPVKENSTLPETTDSVRGELKN